MLKYLFVLVLLLVGCAAEDMEVRYHEVQRSELAKLSDYGISAYGYTVWGGNHCDIYVMPISSYPSEECYRKVIEHEERHCYEGNFHSTTYMDSVVQCD